MNISLKRLNLNNNKVFKKTLFITSWVGISFLVILVIFVFLWQFRVNLLLRQNLSARKKEVKAMQKANRRFVELKKQSEELKHKRELLDKRLPVGEKQPMDLIKGITLMVRGKGLEKINFEIKSQSALGEENISTLNLEKDLAPLYFEMKFETTFPQLLEFLKDLMNLERVVSVEKLIIIREKEILPNQKVTLSLVTYTLQTSDEISAP